MTIYSRPECHLCHEARSAILGSGVSNEDFDLEEINIDEDRSLADRYGCDIPVVLINGIKVFKHRVDPREFKRKLKRFAEARRTPGSQ